MRRLLDRHDTPTVDAHYGPDDLTIDRPAQRGDIDQMHHALQMERLRQRGHWHRWGPIIGLSMLAGVVLIVVMLVGLPALIELAELGVQEKTAELAIAREKGDASKWTEAQVILMLVGGLVLAAILKGWGK